MLAGGGEKTTATSPAASAHLPMLAPFTAEPSLEMEAIEQVRKILRRTDINRTTPLRALIILDNIKQLL